MNQNHSAYYLKAEETGTIVYHNNAQRLATNGVGVTIYHQLDTRDITAIGGNFTGIVTALDFVGGGINTSGTSQFNDVVIGGLTVTGLSTFAGLVDINAGGQANTFKVEDLTSGRVVLAGTGGELQDSANLTFNGSTLGVTGDASFSGNVSIGGTLTYEDVTNIDAVGLITARDGIIVGSGITLSVDGDVFATGVVTATSFVGSGSGLTGVASTDDIRTNTNATFLQNINVSGTVTATSYAGSGANLTALNATQLTSGTIPDARFPATLPAVSGANLTNIPAGQLTGSLPGNRWFKFNWC